MSAAAPARAAESDAALTEHTYRRLSAQAAPRVLTASEARATQALRLWQRLTTALLDAYGEGAHDRMKRIRRIRGRAADRAARRYQSLTPAPRVPLGNLHKDPIAARKRAAAERAQLRAA